jgi:hypothetical protein
VGHNARSPGRHPGAGSRPPAASVVLKPEIRYACPSSLRGRFYAIAVRAVAIALCAALISSAKA